MSRSYKKRPFVKDNEAGSKQAKRLANRNIRRKLKNPEFDAGNGNHYKKMTESWEIHDYVQYWPREQAIATYESRMRNREEWEWFFESYPTLGSWLKYWESVAKRK